MNSGCIAQTAKTPIADLAVPYPEPIDVNASAHAMPRNEKKDATMVQSSAAMRKTERVRLSLFSVNVRKNISFPDSREAQDSCLRLNIQKQE